MTFKNSVKLLMNNFNIVWKQLLYMTVVVILIALCSSAIMVPVMNMLKQNNWFHELSEAFAVIYTEPKNTAVEINAVATSLWGLICTNIKTIWGCFVGAFFMIYFVGEVLYFIGFYAMGVVLNEKMSSNADLGFTGNLFSNIIKGFRYGLMRFLITLPFMLAFVGLLYLYFNFANTVLLIIVMLPVVVMLAILLFAIKTTLLACSMPIMVNENVGAFRAFSTGITRLKGRFMRTFSNAIVINLCIMVGNVFMGVFTIGAGLILTIPATMVFIVIFNLVVYYCSSKKNFYINQATIVQIK